jgi:hypothetical protein
MCQRTFRTATCGERARVSFEHHHRHGWLRQAAGVHELAANDETEPEGRSPRDAGLFFLPFLPNRGVVRVLEIAGRRHWSRARAERDRAGREAQDGEDEEGEPHVGRPTQVARRDHSPRRAEAFVASGPTIRARPATRAPRAGRSAPPALHRPSDHVAPYRRDARTRFGDAQSTLTRPRFTRGRRCLRARETPVSPGKTLARREDTDRPHRCDVRTSGRCVRPNPRHGPSHPDHVERARLYRAREERSRIALGDLAPPLVRDEPGFRRRPPLLEDRAQRGEEPR